ncbi:hypothetical protein JZ751_012713 [Albula glossodonta]|uniref:Phospholipid/glycerol acyltransferase domain-containing protein n=1 Tax=Albula glossodonta TaxID=121402 RepID=A0A8T2N4G9_9TELE|nr:hypothetical protein JZ751_012713 [Albula glossodonta]
MEERERVEAWMGERERVEAWMEERERVEAWMEERERVEAWMEERERVEAWMEERERVEAWMEERERVEAWMEERERVEAWMEERERVEACMEERERVEAWMEERERVEAWMEERERVEAWMEERERVEAWMAERERVEAWMEERERVEAWMEERERVEAWMEEWLDVGDGARVKGEGDGREGGSEGRGSRPVDKGKSWRDVLRERGSGAGLGTVILSDGPCKRGLCSTMALLAYLKTLFILQLLISFVFVVSGLIINFIQLCTCVLWPFNKQLYRRINCRLSYSLWSLTFTCVYGALSHLYLCVWSPESPLPVCVETPESPLPSPLPVCVEPPESPLPVCVEPPDPESPLPVCVERPDHLYLCVWSALSHLYLCVWSPESPLPVCVERPDHLYLCVWSPLSHLYLCVWSALSHLYLCVWSPESPLPVCVEPPDPESPLPVVWSLSHLYLCVWSPLSHLYLCVWSPESPLPVCVEPPDHLYLCVWSALSHLYLCVWSPESPLPVCVEPPDHLYLCVWSPESPLPVCVEPPDHLYLCVWSPLSHLYLCVWSPESPLPVCVEPPELQVSVLMDWMKLVMLLEWWSCTDCTLYTDQATVDKFGKEHAIIILNHNYEIDFLCGWTMCERYGVLGVRLELNLQTLPPTGLELNLQTLRLSRTGVKPADTAALQDWRLELNLQTLRPSRTGVKPADTALSWTGSSKVLAKHELLKVPLIGWTWYFLEIVFCKRKWELDRETVFRGLERLRDYPEYMWFLLYCEGTRFTEKKHQISMQVAESKGLPKLKHHLLPRTKGFTTTLACLKGTVTAVYDVTLNFKDKKNPTLLGIISAQKYRADMHVRYAMIYLPSGVVQSTCPLVSSVPPREVSTVYLGSGCSAVCNSLCKEAGKVLVAGVLLSCEAHLSLPTDPAAVAGLYAAPWWRRFPVEEIPEEESECANWLHKLYQEKVRTPLLLLIGWIMPPLTPHWLDNAPTHTSLAGCLPFLYVPSSLMQLCWPDLLQDALQEHYEKEGGFPGPTIIPPRRPWTLLNFLFWATLLLSPLINFAWGIIISGSPLLIIGFILFIIIASVAVRRLIGVTEVKKTGSSYGDQASKKQD